MEVRADGTPRLSFLDANDRVIAEFPSPVK